MRDDKTAQQVRLAALAQPCFLAHVLGRRRALQSVSTVSLGSRSSTNIARFLIWRSEMARFLIRSRAIPATGFARSVSSIIPAKNSPAFTAAVTSWEVTSGRFSLAFFSLSSASQISSFADLRPGISATLMSASLVASHIVLWVTTSRNTRGSGCPTPFSDEGIRYTGSTAPE